MIAPCPSRGEWYELTDKINEIITEVNRLTVRVESLDEEARNAYYEREANASD